jgi:hypothetical protein
MHGLNPDFGWEYDAVHDEAGPSTHARCFSLHHGLIMADGLAIVHSPRSNAWPV